MDQSYLPFLNIVSQKMIPHFYVLGFGMEHWVLGNTYGIGAVTLKWDIVGDSPRGPLKQRGNPHLKPATKPKHNLPNPAGNRPTPQGP
jgi:hypothetical protein